MAERQVLPPECTEREMSGSNFPHGKESVGQAAEEELMARYGITRVRADYFEWGGYRYTRLQEALDYARRQQRRA